MMTYAVICLLALLLILVVYHHIGYPLVLKWLAQGKPRAVLPEFKDEDAPFISLVVPIYNEAGVIAAKLENLCQLRYPRNKLEILLSFDGCTDASLDIAESWLGQNCDCAEGIKLLASPHNLGKVARLNLAMKEARGDIVVLNDVSAALPPDTLERMAAGFQNPNVGLVCPSYGLPSEAHTTEKGYWRYQGGIKRLEARLHAPMGAHGACYGFRKTLFAPLPLDTINDDVILPMRIVAEGHKCLYLENVVVSELCATPPRQDFERRIRLGAGNLQQAVRLWNLTHTSRNMAFIFLSGKALRGVMPFILAAIVGLCLAGIAFNPLIFALPVAGIGVLMCLAFLQLYAGKSLPAPFGLMAYVVGSYYACLVGSIRYLKGDYSRSWTGEAPWKQNKAFVPLSTRIMKRSFDIVLALGALAVLIVLYVPLAILIKLESKGPVIYRQTRVGEATATHTRLFSLYKFRTMRNDAEAATGPVWAQENDPRVTRLGRFLRKSRIDELPQAINVLKGDMSVVGPRPERPNFFTDLEAAIPFYGERTYGIKPGITGLAQITTGYDSSVEDVRAKVLYDHVYALRLSGPLSWAKTDLSIALRTFSVMVLGLGR